MDIVSLLIVWLDNPDTGQKVVVYNSNHCTCTTCTCGVVKLGMCVLWYVVSVVDKQSGSLVTGYHTTLSVGSWWECPKSALLHCSMYNEIKYIAILSCIIYNNNSK